MGIEAQFRWTFEQWFVEHGLDEGCNRERTLDHGELRVVLWSQGRCPLCCLVASQSG